MDPVPIPELSPEQVPQMEVSQILEEAESMALRKKSRKLKKPVDPEKTLSDDDINRIATALAMKLKEVPAKPPVVEKPKLPPVTKPSFNWI